VLIRAGRGPARHGSEAVRGPGSGHGVPDWPAGAPLRTGRLDPRTGQPAQKL